MDMSAGVSKGDTCRSGAEGDGWSSEGTVLGADDYFGEEALLVDDPRAASVVATSRSASCMVVDRVAYDVATRGTPENVFHSRTRATKDIEMMWRRLRFQRELQRVPLLAELDPYEARGRGFLGGRGREARRSIREGSKKRPFTPLPPPANKRNAR